MSSWRFSTSVASPRAVSRKRDNPSREFGVPLLPQPRQRERSFPVPSGIGMTSMRFNSLLRRSIFLSSLMCLFLAVPLSWFMTLLEQISRRVDEIQLKVPSPPQLRITAVVSSVSSFVSRARSRSSPGRGPPSEGLISSRVSSGRRRPCKCRIAWRPP